MPSAALGSIFSLSEEFIAKAVLATDALDGASGCVNEPVVATVPELTAMDPPNSVQPELPPQRASIPSETGTTCTTCGIGGDMGQRRCLCPAPRCEGVLGNTGQLCMPAGVASGTFASVAEQRAHFRSDWHRCNVRRRLGGRPALGEAEFERCAQEGGGDLSSISGSDSDDSEAEERRGSHAGAGLLQRSAEVVFVSGECFDDFRQPAPLRPASVSVSPAHAYRVRCMHGSCWLLLDFGKERREDVAWACR